MCPPSWTPFPPPSPSHPSGSSQYPSPEHLSHASNLDWWSVSHLIIYMFRCCSLRSSHPRLLSQSPKVCSIHLCLFFCLACRVSEFKASSMHTTLSPSPTSLYKDIITYHNFKQPNRFLSKRAALQIFFE